MLASTLELDESEILNVIEAYQNALSLLDDYDHGPCQNQKELIQFIDLPMKNVEN